MTCQDWNHPSRIQRSDNATRTEASCEPVTIDEVRDDAHMGFGDNDDIIGDYIKVSRQFTEDEVLWKTLITQTCIDKFNCFGGQFELAWQPVQSVTSVTYIDGNGDSQTLSTDVYELANKNGAARVRLKENQVWPVAQSHEDVVTITYVSGFGDEPSDVPITIRMAIRLYARELLLETDGDITPPLGYFSLLSGQSAARPLA